jgi:glycerol-3-phosphate cytidylyltransferase
LERAKCKLLLGKKERKPVIKFEERAEIIDSIKYVDLVVPEDDTDKINAWRKYKYDVIFKGSDWKGSKLWNDYEIFFRDHDVEIMFFPYTKGTSSTQLRDVLNKLSNGK